jgi:hypothetical protein
MTLPNRPRYATRLNAFKQKGDLLQNVRQFFTASTIVAKKHDHPRQARAHHLMVRTNWSK